MQGEIMKRPFMEAYRVLDIARTGESRITEGPTLLRAVRGGAASALQGFPDCQSAERAALAESNVRQGRSPRARFGSRKGILTSR
jgi:hypothetical protein